MRNDERVETCGNKVGAKPRETGRAHGLAYGNGLAGRHHGREESFERCNLRIYLVYHHHRRYLHSSCRRELRQLERAWRIVLRRIVSWRIELRWLRRGRCRRHRRCFERGRRYGWRGLSGVVEGQRR